MRWEKTAQTLRRISARLPPTAHPSSVVEGSRQHLERI